MPCTGEWVAEAGSAPPIPKGMELLLDGTLDIHLEGFCHTFLADGVSGFWLCALVLARQRYLRSCNETVLALLQYTSQRRVSYIVLCILNVLQLLGLSQNTVRAVSCNMRLCMLGCAAAPDPVCLMLARDLRSIHVGLSAQPCFGTLSHWDFHCSCSWS